MLLHTTSSSLISLYSGSLDNVVLPVPLNPNIRLVVLRYVNAPQCIGSLSNLGNSKLTIPNTPFLISPKNVVPAISNILLSKCTYILGSISIAVLCQIVQSPSWSSAVTLNMFQTNCL